MVSYICWSVSSAASRSCASKNSPSSHGPDPDVFDAIVRYTDFDIDEAARERFLAGNSVAAFGLHGVRVRTVWVGDPGSHESINEVSS